MAEIVIKTTHAWKTFMDGEKEIHAVNDVSLDIYKGEFTAIVGPSGSGKSTLLNLIGGLDTPSKGTVEVGGMDISKLSDKELIDFRLAHIGFVFQAYNLIPVLSARENAEFTMLLQNRTKEERINRSMQLLEAVGLKGKEHKKPGQLSGGEQQRVAVARALAPKPDFVLADEPTANLDSKSTENLLEIMANLNQKEHTTFVFATHDQRVINKARRVITIEDGKVVSDENKGDRQ